MRSIHLRSIFNNINDEMLDAIDTIKSDSVKRDEHNFWFDTNASQQVIDDLCAEFNLIQLD